MGYLSANFLIAVRAAHNLSSKLTMSEFMNILRPVPCHVIGVPIDELRTLLGTQGNEII